MQRISYAIRFFEHVKKNGKAGLYLQLTIDRIPRRISLELEFYPQLFDKDKEQFKYDGVNDEEITDLNLLINKEKGKANELLRRYRLADREVTHQSFKLDFLNYASRDNFVSWAKAKLEAANMADTIKLQTYKNKKNRLKHFETFTKGNVLFSEIDPELIAKFDKYLRSNIKLRHNSIQAVHVTINSFLKEAIRNKINVENPYEQFKIKAFKKGKRDPLEIGDLKKLKQLYSSKRLESFPQEILRKFLFSCETGLRISDNNALDYEDIENRVLTVSTIKGERFGVVVSVPLTKYALTLIDPTKRRGAIFKNICDQVVNRNLKIIAAKAEINRSLTFHCSRDTFATNFIDAGGNAETLMSLLGHAEIKTTMIYVKISEARKKKLIMNLDSL